jgi:hypothetical protein
VTTVRPTSPSPSPSSVSATPALPIGASTDVLPLPFAFPFPAAPPLPTTFIERLLPGCDPELRLLPPPHEPRLPVLDRLSFSEEGWEEPSRDVSGEAVDERSRERERERDLTMRENMDGISRYCLVIVRLDVVWCGVVRVLVGMEDVCCVCCVGGTEAEMVPRTAIVTVTYSSSS